jgi:transcriptional regulator with XRE-family HTH domain
MRYVYLKTELKDLSQVSRIAFAREFRYLTQDNVSDKLGLTGECKRRSMARYERGDRVPKKERLQEIANILNVNVRCLKEYDFRNGEDMIYILLWMEELYPRMNIDLGLSESLPKESDIKLKRFFEEWNAMKEKRVDLELSYDDYVEWKLQYDFNKGDEYEEDS